MDGDTRRINRLLSGGKLSGPEADEILERAFEQLDREKQAKARPILLRNWLGGALAAAAAVMLLVFLPRTPGGEVRHPEGGDLTPTKLDVRCSPGTLSSCPLSSSLVFTLSGERASGFLAAWAEPIGHDADRVFYFSKEDGSPQLAWPAQAERPAQRAVRLPPSQRPGRYRVHALVADQPQAREALARAGAAQSAARVVAKVEREIVIIE